MNDFFLSLLLLGSLSSGGPMPFWATANRYGLMPEASGTTALLQAYSITDPEKAWQMGWGVRSAVTRDSYHPAGVSGAPATRLLVDQLYVDVRWKNLKLYAGAQQLGNSAFLGSGESLSVTGGSVLWSGNVRGVPGVSLHLSPAAIPFTQGRLRVFGSWGEFRMTDRRYTVDPLLHRMMAGLEWRMSPRWTVWAGLDHYALWGGVNPENGRMPLTLDNYFRMALGMHAASGSKSDMLNVIGDQRGAEFLRVKWAFSSGWSLTAQHDIPYDDSSGMRFQNFPDGVNTLFLSRNVDRREWVTAILYEYHNTMWQSGTRHDRPTTDEEKQHLDPADEYHYEKHIIGGGDNYFNNGAYRTAWTNYGRTIGNPLFFPKGTHAGTWDPAGVTLGVENNRIRAHHFALSGYLFQKAPYRLMLTYSRNYGLYPEPYAGESQWGKDPGTVKETPLRQVSMGLDVSVPLGNLFRRCPMSLVFGAYADKGSVLPDTSGMILGLKCEFR